MQCKIVPIMLKLKSQKFQAFVMLIVIWQPVCHTAAKTIVNIQCFWWEYIVQYPTYSFRHWNLHFSYEMALSLQIYFIYKIARLI